MSDNKNHLACPEAEELSCFVDGEIPEKHEDIGEHLGECSECGAIVGAYQRINEVIRDTSAPDQRLRERIKSRCREDVVKLAYQPPARPSLLGGTMVWKAAAVLALALALAALYVAGTGPSVPNDGGLIAEFGPSSPLPPLPAGAPDSGGIMPGSEAALAFRQPHLRLRDLTPAAVASNSYSGALFDLSRERAMLTRVPADVRHVWIGSDKDHARVAEYLHRTYPEGTWTRDDGMHVYRVSLPDTLLQNMVDSVVELGPSLVSPSPPQPGYTARTAFTGEDVDYQLRFIVQ